MWPFRTRRRGGFESYEESDQEGEVEEEDDEVESSAA